VDDDHIDREFNAVCMSVWGYTTDDFSDDLFSLKDHEFLDRWTRRVRASSPPSTATIWSTTPAFSPTGGAIAG
jgi:hypothetical protein